MMHLSLRQFALVFLGLLLTAQAMATQAGWRQINIPGSTLDAAPIPVALYYPTQTPARSIPMGPFTAQVAIQAPPDATFKGLIVLSHGTGGTELGYSGLAEALAQHGYLVAALRHPGDNWQDRTLLQKGAEFYFTERPQHVSLVLDALLRDSNWSDRIARDAQGPRIGAVGHSAGGYTVLALAGGQPDLSRIATHCEVHRADDSIFCSMGRTGQPATSFVAPTQPERSCRRASITANPYCFWLTTAPRQSASRSSIRASRPSRWPGSSSSTTFSFADPPTSRSRHSVA